MTLTSKVGKFIFDDEMPISKAKLIRDTVMGQILNPQDGRKIKTDDQAFNFARDSFPGQGLWIKDIILV